MSQARVDKQWQTKGLEGYGADALLGTLAHYGVSTSEAAFKEAAAAGRYPLSLAREWQAAWKGTGPFAAFPYAAAAELWRRWVPDRPAPEELARALARAMDALAERASGKGGADADAALGRVREVLGQAPGGEARQAYVHEALSAFDERAMRVFDGLGEALAKQGKGEDARAFAALEEELLPERQGVASAIVRAHLGERDAALQGLAGVGGDAAREVPVRVMAVDALLHLEAWPEAQRLLRALLADAEAAPGGGDVHLALELAARLEHAALRSGDSAAVQAARADLRRLEAAHAVAHPHHGHRHR